MYDSIVKMYEWVATIWAILKTYESRQDTCCVDNEFKLIFRCDERDERQIFSLAKLTAHGNAIRWLEKNKGIGVMDEQIIISPSIAIVKFLFREAEQCNFLQRVVRLRLPAFYDKTMLPFSYFIRRTERIASI